MKLSETVAVLVLAAGLSGCDKKATVPVPAGDRPVAASPIKADGSNEAGQVEAAQPVPTISLADFGTVARTVTTALLASGVLDKVTNAPALIEVGRLLNNTSQPLDLGLVANKIGTALLQSGKAQIKSADPRAAQYQQEAEFMNGQKTRRIPDFILSGGISESVQRVGTNALVSYSFHFMLNDIKTGVQVWGTDMEISKQGTRSSVGF